MAEQTWTYHQGIKSKRTGGGKGERTELSLQFSFFRNNERCLWIFCLFLSALKMSCINANLTKFLKREMRRALQTHLSYFPRLPLSDAQNNVQRNVFFQNNSCINRRPGMLVSLNDWCGTFWRDKKRTVQRVYVPYLRWRH